MIPIALRQVLATTVVALILVVLSACGGDGGSGSTSSAPASPLVATSALLAGRVMIPARTSGATVAVLIDGDPAAAYDATTGAWSHPVVLDGPLTTVAVSCTVDGVEVAHRTLTVRR